MHTILIWNWKGRSALRTGAKKNLVIIIATKSATDTLAILTGTIVRWVSIRGVIAQLRSIVGTFS